MRRLFQISTTCLLAGALLVNAAAGEIFVLESGARIQGEWLNRNDRPVTSYKIKTTSGLQLTLDKSQVKETIHQRQVELDYNRIAPKFGNTIEEQWKLAEWCRERLLKEERAVHLQRILQIDPGHAPARYGLGYTQLNGEWKRQKDWQAEQGYFLYHGSWRTAQEIELLEAQANRERAEREWLMKLRRHREALATENWAEHWQQIRAVCDPLAIPALAQLLKIDPSRNAKILYIETLSEIGTGTAANVIINTSLNDPDVEVFFTCVDEIVRMNPPHAVKAYIKGLKDQNNVRVNRSAEVLGRLGDKEAIVPLIEALVTTHVMTTPGRQVSGSATPFDHTFVSPANDSANQIMPGGTSMSFNDDPPRAIPVVVPNQRVLAALVKLSGGTSFGFNKKAWTNWHAMQREDAPKLSGR